VTASESPPRARILVVEDEAALRRIAQFRLEEAGYEVRLADDGSAGLDAFTSFAPDLVLTDVRMPGLDGEALVDAILARDPTMPIVVMTGHGTVERAVRAMRQGVADYLTKPLSWDETLIVIQRTLDSAALRRDNAQLHSALERRVRFEGIVGESETMQGVFRAIDRLAGVGSTVLIQGESGTGKELVARALHYHGIRKNGPFVAVNCGALPRDLVESELFGHEKGAFTGAERTHAGYFEQASGGTLFLDEIGEIPAHAQVRLLRVLTEKCVRRVGGEQAEPVDVRVIAATNRDLEAAVEEGDFREDLYYRVAVVPLRLPPLRERRDDIAPIAEALASRAAGRPIQLARGALRVLRDHDWPGNVRELENVMERAVVMGSGADVIQVDDLPSSLSAAAPLPADPTEFPDDGVDLSEIERGWIRRALLHCGGNRSRAARALGISRQTLLYRMQKHAIDIPAESGGEPGA
jgi:two-component system NtrC family response regulator